MSLINDVLDMIKLESSEILLANNPFDLRKMTGDCSSVIVQTAADSDIALQEHMDAQIIRHPYLLGGPLHLRLVIRTLHARLEQKK